MKSSSVQSWYHFGQFTFFFASFFIIHPSVNSLTDNVLALVHFQTFTTKRRTERFFLLLLLWRAQRATCFGVHDFVLLRIWKRVGFVSYILLLNDFEWRCHFVELWIWLFQIRIMTLLAFSTSKKLFKIHHLQ